MDSFLSSPVGILALTLAQTERFGITAESRVLQFASLSFDASVMEVMMAFAAGATLHYKSGSIRLQPQQGR